MGEFIGLMKEEEFLNQMSTSSRHTFNMCVLVEYFHSIFPISEFLVSC